MKRITVDRVVQAYLETSLVPIRHEFYDIKDDGVPCACGLGAIMLAEARDGESLLSAFVASYGAVTITLHPASDLDLSEDYAIGFESGFDGDDFSTVQDSLSDDDSEDKARLGYQDGIAAAQAVFSP